MGKFLIAISRILAIFAVVGLVLAPVGTAVAADPGPGSKIMVMLDDMPPCDEQPPDCVAMKDCPWLSPSYGSGHLFAPASSAQVFPPRAGKSFTICHDMTRDGLTLPPPARPPRT
jgi:hypothetical protein